MHPNLLALDTSTPRAVLAARLSDGRVLVAAPDPAPRHGRSLVPAIRDLLAAAGLPLQELDGIVVGLGPGSYTGLRIGVTAAKTLAYTLGRPLAGFDSLDLLARNVPADATRLSVIGDAQRGDLHVADFIRLDPSAAWTRVGPTRVEAAVEWAAAREPGTCVLGPAATGRLASVIPSHAVRPHDPEADWPDPERLAELAVELWESGRRDDPWYLEPVYLRRSAAEEQWDKKTRGG